MWTAAGLNTDDPLGIQNSFQGCPDVVLVLLRKDVIGHNKRAMTRGDQHRNECFYQSCLSRADGAPDPDSSGAGEATQIQVVIVLAYVVMVVNVIHLASSACKKTEFCLLVVH
jgi:hypothetical protein